MQNVTSRDSRRPDLSVIIVNWNVGHLVMQCLESLYRLTTQVLFEVFVVDNCSRAGDLDEVMLAYPEVQFMVLKENLGFGAANNLAIQQARGRYIALLNPDTILINDAFDLLIHFMESRPEQGAVGPKLVTPDGGVQYDAGRNLPSLMTEFSHNFFFHHLFPNTRIGGSDYLRWWDHLDTREVGALCGACMVVRAEAISEAGMLDERFFLYWEDVEWCHRLKIRGWHITYLPAAEVHHLGGHSMAQDTTSLESSYRSAVLYFRKHHGFSAAILARTFIFCGSILRIILWLAVYANRRRRFEAKSRLRCYWRTLLWVLTGWAESGPVHPGAASQEPVSVKPPFSGGFPRASKHSPLAAVANDSSLKIATSESRLQREKEL